MFENILHQTQVVNQLKSDIASLSLAPSILFSGPEYAGKGTAALELARVLSCDEQYQGARGGWNCACPSCIRHRNLVSPDLLILGKKRFFEESSAASRAFLGFPENPGSRMLFIRSIRKLLARFNSVLWEDDPKFKKLAAQIGVLEEELEDAESFAVGPSFSEEEKTKLAKKCENIIKKAAKLEAEGLGELIPISRIRRAAYWSRLAPLGRHKCVIIENAENMQEGAKNSLLKILEEPPPRLSIILTSSRPVSLLPTILSRLREYRFSKRSAEEEAELISRIFKEEIKPYGNNLIESYMSSFLPVSGETLFSLGAFFSASVAAETVRELQKKQQEIPVQLVELGKFTVPIAEEGSIGRPAGNVKNTLEKVIGTAEGFEISGLFTQFLQQCSAVISAWLRSGEQSAKKTAWADMWRNELNQSILEHNSYNVSPLMTMERLFEKLRTGMI